MATLLVALAPPPTGPGGHAAAARAGTEAVPGTDAVSTADTASGTGARRPFPQHVTYPRWVLRPSGPTQAQVDGTVLRFWRAWKARYVQSLGSPGLWVQHHWRTTVSEGQGYGMIFAAYFGDRATFDGLYRHFRAHPSRYSPDLMAWKQRYVGGRMLDVEGGDSATDGDLDIAYALQLADRQWGSTGAVDYAAEAQRVSRAVLAHDVNHRLGNTTPGDWSRGNDLRHTRPSDLMPAHFLAFARHDPANRQAWLNVHRTAIRIVRQQFRHGSRRTGLLPDFMVFRRGRWRPVPGTYLETRHDGDYGYNACRTPWRLTMPVLLGRDELLPVLRTQARWFRLTTDGHPGRLRSGYYVRNGPNGNPFVAWRDLAFTAPVAVEAMLGGPRGQRWLDRLWHGISPRRTITEYYGDSLRLMALLVISRNAWQP